MKQLIFYEVEKIYIGKTIVYLINNDRKNQYLHAEKWSWTPFFFFYHIPIPTLMDLNGVPQTLPYNSIQKRPPKSVSRKRHDQWIDEKTAQYHQLIIKEMQIKTTMKHLLSAVGMARIKKTRVSKHVEEGDSNPVCMGMGIFINNM